MLLTGYTVFLVKCLVKTFVKMKNLLKTLLKCCEHPRPCLAPFFQVHVCLHFSRSDLFPHPALSHTLPRARFCTPPSHSRQPSQPNDKDDDSGDGNDDGGNDDGGCGDEQITTVMSLV